MTEDEIRFSLRNGKDIGLNYFSAHINLSEKFIREFADKINWINVSFYQKLSEEFIKEFSDKVDWFYISYRQKLSIEFIKEFSDKINWHVICRSTKLSKTFLKKFQHQIDRNQIPYCYADIDLPKSWQTFL